MHAEKGGPPVGLQDQPLAVITPRTIAANTTFRSAAHDPTAVLRFFSMLQSGQINHHFGVNCYSVSDPRLEDGEATRFSVH